MRKSALLAQILTERTWNLLEWAGLLLLLAGLIAAGVWIVTRVRGEVVSRASADEQRQALEKLLDEGNLEPQEAERIRSLLANGKTPPPGNSSSVGPTS